MHFPKVAFLTTGTLEIRTCLNGDNLALPEATLCPVQSADDVISLMRLGEVNRAVGATAVNITSSRSHRSISSNSYVVLHKFAETSLF